MISMKHVYAMQVL